MGVLDALLEGFHPGEPRDWHGRFRAGDMVRLKKQLPNGDPVVGRIQRFTDDGKKAIVAPVHGGPHVEAGPADIAFHSPKEATAHIRRQLADPAQAYPEAQRSGYKIPSGKADPNLARQRQAQEKGGDATVQIKVSGGRAAARGRGYPSPSPDVPTAMRQMISRRQRRPVRESLLEIMLEAFAIPPAAPSETPAQSQARGAAQVAAAQKSLSSGWNAAKHPRARGGKFGYTTGGKRATRGHARRKGSTSSPRTLNTGSRGALVQSIQRTLNVPQDGVYGPQTKGAVARYQRQHGLQVDGVVGAQTLASMRGSTNARLVAPGPITSRQARVAAHRQPKATKAKAKKPKAPVRIGGGIVV